MTFWTFLEQLEKAKLLRFGRVSKNLFCSIQSAPVHLLVKFKKMLGKFILKLFKINTFLDSKNLLVAQNFQNGFRLRRSYNFHSLSNG